MVGTTCKAKISTLFGSKNNIVLLDTSNGSKVATGHNLLQLTKQSKTKPKTPGQNNICKHET